MKQFCNFLKQSGMSDAHALVSLLDNFNKYPEMILNMSDKEINHFEARIDSASTGNGNKMAPTRKTERPQPFLTWRC